MKCENCKQEHDGKYGSGRFCGCKCARGFSTKNKRKEINEKVSNSLTGRIMPPEEREKRRKNPIKEKRIKILIPKKPCLNCLNLTGNKKFCCKKCYINYHDKKKTPYRKYKEESHFRFNVYKYPEYFNLDLINQHGWYGPPNRGNNINGVSRDHLYSRSAGFKNGIDPKILAHPANCELILHKENQRKRSKCKITLEELHERIEDFNRRVDREV